MPSNGLPRPNRTQIRLGIACVVAYAIGYPVAIVVGSPIGWLLVTLGGVLLFALVAVTVLRIDRGESLRRRDGP